MYYVAGNGESNESIREMRYGRRPMISASGFTKEKAIELTSNKGDLIVFGRQFVLNVRLVFVL